MFTSVQTCLALLQRNCRACVFGIILMALYTIILQDVEASAIKDDEEEEEGANEEDEN